MSSPAAVRTTASSPRTSGASSTARAAAGAARRASSCSGAYRRRRRGGARMSEALIAAWTRVQRAMIRTRPEAFTRDEWAYLIAFVDAERLRGGFDFGPGVLPRPRGRVALWPPNNVSLLRQLTLILPTLTGNRVRVKAGSRAAEPASAF